MDGIDLVCQPYLDDPLLHPAEDGPNKEQAHQESDRSDEAPENAELNLPGSTLLAVALNGFANFSGIDSCQYLPGNSLRPRIGIVNRHDDPVASNYVSCKRSLDRRDCVGPDRVVPSRLFNRIADPPRPRLRGKSFHTPHIKELCSIKGDRRALESRFLFLFRFVLRLRRNPQPGGNQNPRCNQDDQEISCSHHSSSWKLDETTIHRKCGLNYLHHCSHTVCLSSKLMTQCCSAL